jgi:ABC-type nitrate/sulfonate/bicarbonate transport system substrate-binding protein
MRELRIIYRSNSHAPFWVLAEKCGAWENNGLRVNTSPQLVRQKAVESLKGGDVDLISGNHHNLYARRAKNREDFVHLAQLGNQWTENRMVARDSIRTVQDLKGKKVAIDKLNSHAGLNVWLFLRQEGLDFDKHEVELIEAGESAEKRWQGVLSGEFDATFVATPQDLRAAAAGARVIPVRAMPMIRGVTLTTTMEFVRSHEEEIRLLMLGVVEGIHFFLTRKDETMTILGEATHLGLRDYKEVEAVYQEWTGFLDRKPYPAPEAITNVFTLALRRNPEIQDLSPMTLWNTHYLRELDDSGFIDALYR